MSNRMSGKIAVVTGAAQGLGFGIAKRLREEGATVILTDVSATKVAAAAAEIGAAHHVQDVAIEGDWTKLLETIRERHGGLHVLVNNAGIEGDPSAPKDPEHAPLADWNRIFQVNAAGAFLGCKHAIPLMTKSGGGSIINLASVASMLPVPFITAYGASKAAVEHLSRSVALHCARAGQSIRCNSVHPGQIRTPMLEGLFERMGAAAGVTTDAFAQNFAMQIPLGKFQEPVDIANLVLFLASDDARYITGQAIAVDGGLTLAM